MIPKTVDTVSLQRQGQCSQSARTNLEIYHDVAGLGKNIETHDVAGLGRHIMTE
jgi:hypothetical protein